MAEALSLADIPVRISNTAGTYVCNHLFYTVMNLLESNKMDILAGFVHLPYLPIQTLGKEGTPSIPLEQMLDGLERLIEICGYDNGFVA